MSSVTFGNIYTNHITQIMKYIRNNAKTVFIKLTYSPLLVRYIFIIRRTDKRPVRTITVKNNSEKFINVSILKPSSSSTYSIISPGWQLRSLHIFSIASREAFLPERKYCKTLSDRSFSFLCYNLHFLMQQ